jgi:hypothetical protein
MLWWIGVSEGALMQPFEGYLWYTHNEWSALPHGSGVFQLVCSVPNVLIQYKLTARCTQRRMILANRSASVWSITGHVPQLFAVHKGGWSFCTSEQFQWADAVVPRDLCTRYERTLLTCLGSILMSISYNVLKLITSVREREHSLSPVLH